jgi:hypothetical protein
MSEPLPEERKELDWNLASAEAAYSVIAHYVEHTQITGLLIASLASALGEERLKPIVQSEPWQMYLASRRALEEARGKIEALTRLIERTRKQAAGGEADATSTDESRNQR